MEGKTNILIIGGGFAGVRCALDLNKSVSDDINITLVSKDPHFDYHAGLYNIVTGMDSKEANEAMRSCGTNPWMPAPTAIPPRT